jgi:hypothetical protein
MQVNKQIFNLDQNDTYDTWKCKCRCVSKRAHKSKWASISYFKKNKQPVSQIQSISQLKKSPHIGSSIVVKKKSNPTNPYKNILQTNQNKKVRYDPILKKIILDSNVNSISEPSEPIKNHEQIILFELRDLIKNTK